MKYSIQRQSEIYNSTWFCGCDKLYDTFRSNDPIEIIRNVLIISMIEYDIQVY